MNLLLACCAILIWVGFSGCVTPPLAQLTADATPSGECFVQTEPEYAKVTGTRGIYYLKTPISENSAGKYHRFPWASDVEKLVHINITAAWQRTAPSALEDELRIDIQDKDGEHPFEGREGPTPLFMDVDIIDATILGDSLKVQVRAPHDGFAPGVSYSIPDNEVLLTVVQTYRC